ncbi:MAG TPA: succinate dehydrogenase cytochrome b subunit [Moheibacter sp.]|nr:succinate dehydrogenase cytochrome b subunit [Moheibacter sp.]
MAKESLFQSSIGRKFAMALSALFLLVFLLMHFVANLTSVFSESAFNEISQFMGYNPFVQYLMQPILTIAVIYHFVMGFILEIQNRKARPVKYAYNQASANSTWMSRNMIWSGLAILAFLILHFIDFWFPEMNYKFIEAVDPADPTRFYHELQVNFSNPIRVVAYVVAFFLLMMHLLHGFQSAFQSIGANHKKYTPFIRSFGKAFAIIIPVGFMFIAVFHYLNSIM